jgi:hypothetical protein
MIVLFCFRKERKGTMIFSSTFKLGWKEIFPSQSSQLWLNNWMIPVLRDLKQRCHPYRLS